MPRCCLTLFQSVSEELDTRDICIIVYIRVFCWTLHFPTFVHVQFIWKDIRKKLKVEGNLKLLPFYPIIFIKPRCQISISYQKMFRLFKKEYMEFKTSSLYCVTSTIIIKVLIVCLILYITWNFYIWTSTSLS